MPACATGTPPCLPVAAAGVGIACRAPAPPDAQAPAGVDTGEVPAADSMPVHGAGTPGMSQAGAPVGSAT